METLHCPSCGAGLKSDEKKCTYCGMEIIRDKSKMGPALKAREHRENGRYTDALAAYSEWLMDEPKNDLVWTEYMEVLMEIASKQKYKNINAVLEANIVMLKYCLNADLFTEFSDPERILKLVKQMAAACRSIDKKFVGTSDSTDEIDLNRLLEKVQQLMFENISYPGNNDLSTCNLVFFDQFQFLVVAFLNDADTEKCLEYTAIDSKYRMETPLLVSGLKILNALSNTKIQFVEDQMGAKTSVLRLVLMIVGVALVTIVTIGAIAVIAGGDGSPTTIIFLLLAIATLVVEYLFGKMRSPINTVARVVGFLANFASIVGFVPYLILVIVDNKYSKQFKKIDQYQSSLVAPAWYDELAQGKISRRDFVKRLFNM